MVTTGERVRQTRERLVVGQAELAREAGLDHSGLWNIEHGRRKPRPVTLRRLAEALTKLGGETIRPADLLGDEDEAAASDGD